MSSKVNWWKVPEVSTNPRFKFISKHRSMDTSNWIRLKEGFDSLDYSGEEAPSVCWERIGPTRVQPLVTSPAEKSPKSKKHPPTLQHGHPWGRRQKKLIKTPSEIQAERPISAWTVKEIRALAYKPKVMKVPKSFVAVKLSQIVLGHTESNLNKEKQKKVIRGLMNTKPKRKRRNPYQMLRISRHVEDSPTMTWMKCLWKIAREFVHWFDTLGTGNPKVTDSFMVNLLTRGCKMKENTPTQVKQIEHIHDDLPPLVFEKPINYGINPFMSSESSSKPISKRNLANSYGAWYCPVRVWGKLSTKKLGEATSKEDLQVDEAVLLFHPFYGSYYTFLKENGYRVPRIILQEFS